MGLALQVAAEPALTAWHPTLTSCKQLQVPNGSSVEGTFRCHPIDAAAVMLALMVLAEQEDTGTVLLRPVDNTPDCQLQLSKQ